MSKIKKTHSSSFKFKVAITAVIGELTFAEMSQKFKIHTAQVSKWKKHLLDYGPQVFEQNNIIPEDKKLKKENEELYEQIGRLTMERDFLKKTLDI